MCHILCHDEQGKITWYCFVVGERKVDLFGYLARVETYMSDGGAVADVREYARNRRRRRP